MRILTTSIALALSSLSVAQTSNEILYYKFDALAGNRAINQYSGGPRFGNLVTTAKQFRAPGKFGNALQGAESGSAYNYIDSGYTAAIAGSFSFAFFMKERTTLPNSLAYYFFSGEGSFRLFTSGAAGNGLQCRGWGGANLGLTTDIRTPAATRWVHVALSVDGVNKTATWYVDGVQQSRSTIAAAANVPARTVGYRVGAHTRLTTTTWWDIDEFRFLTRPITEVEAKTWSAAAIDYGKGCGATLGAVANQDPKLGNARFGMELQAKAGSPALLSVGFSATKLLGAIPMPLDLGPIFPTLNGCMWESSMDLLGTGLVPASGKLVFPFPIPNLPALVQLPLYSQALVLPSTGPKQTSGGFVFTILP